MAPSRQSTTSLAICRAEREDVVSILRLYASDYGESQDISPELQHEALGVFHEIDADPHSVIYVAKLAGHVVGTFQITFLRHLTHRGARIGHIEAVHVATDHRRQGVGQAMMRFAITDARRRGCRRMQLMSHKGNAQARRLYERLGFVATHEGMKLVQL